MLRKKLRDWYIAIRFGRKRPKVFCIGRNKTGTTSMGKLLRSLGYKVAPQEEAELMIEDWYKGDFSNIIRFTKRKGQAFQDLPYSLPNTYKILDEAFPNSKFILTVRDSSEVWYTSLTSFHAKVFGNGKLPTKEDLMNSTYRRKGFAWQVNRYLHTTPEDDLYHKETLISEYETYNQSVIEYFNNQPNKLLVINLKQEDAAQKIATFLGLEDATVQMPWENKTRS
ncbi:MAG: sulfotransferase [Bacteroidota bacterium]